MKVLVIGGSGFLGKELCRQLKERDFQVYSFQRSWSDKLAKEGIHQILGDLRVSMRLSEAVCGMDVVFHVGGKVDLGGVPQEYFDMNYRGCLHSLRASHRHGVKAYIFTSSPSVFINPKGICGLKECELTYSKFSLPYVQSKIAAEKLLLSQSPKQFAFVILRPHQIWSEESNCFTEGLLAAHSKLRIIGTGKNIVDSIHVKDAARAHICAMSRLLSDPELVSGRDYNLSSSKPFLLWPKINKFYFDRGLKEIDKKVSFKLANIFVRLKSFFAKGDLQTQQYYNIQLSVDRWFDTSRAERDLGFKCEIVQG